MHLALAHGQAIPHQETLVRVHEPANLMDLLDTSNSRHSWPLDQALKTIQASNTGVVVLLNCSATGNNVDFLSNHFSTQKTEDRAPQIRKPDFRTYGIGAQILKDQGVGKMRLMAKPAPISGMSAYQLEVVGYLEPK
jgi:3,4-dihydroxy 2-butanone 4-phosphate synthase/GTP cyclohydrolase II